MASERRDDARYDGPTLVTFGRFRVFPPARLDTLSVHTTTIEGDELKIAGNDVATGPAQLTRLSYSAGSESEDAFPFTVPAVASLEALELELMLDGPHDRNNCILSINAGAGGTESCDWASMMLRMYQRWAEERGWKAEVSELLPGEVAGVKSATLLISGEPGVGKTRLMRELSTLVEVSGGQIGRAHV